MESSPVLTWILAALLGAGILVSAYNLAGKRAPVTSGIFLVLLAAGLWAVLGLPPALALFAVLGIGTLGCALGIVLHPNPAVSAVYMMGSFTGMAAIYLVLGFPFLAMVQILVYSGAIVVLFLFVVMLLDLGRRDEGRSDFRPGPAGPILAGGLTGTALVAFLVAASSAKGAVKDAVDPALLPVKASQAASSVSAGAGFADSLFGRYLLPFEVITFLLLAALVGVILLARHPASGRKEA